MAKRKYNIGQSINGFEIVGLPTRERPGYYTIKCKCGATFQTAPKKLVDRVGCMQCFAEKQTSYRYTYHENQIIGNVTLIKYLPSTGTWLTQCSCGNEFQSNPKELLTRKESKCQQCPRTRTTNPSGLYNSYRHVYKKGARKRKLTFQLTKTEFEQLVNSSCHYCGAEPTRKYYSNNKLRSISINGIDRMDNTQGYILSNCTPCCKRCNFAKRTASYIEFQDWLTQIHKYKCNDHPEGE